MLDRLVVKLAMSMGPIDAAVTQTHSHRRFPRPSSFGRLSVKTRYTEYMSRRYYSR